MLHWLTGDAIAPGYMAACCIRQLLLLQAQEITLLVLVGCYNATPKAGTLAGGWPSYVSSLCSFKQ
jgi:hypothetical protein